MIEKGDVAVFIDFENIYISVHNKYDTDPNFESIMEKCNDYGRVIIARAYADWYRYPRVTSALYAYGIEPMYVPTYYYDRDDTKSSKAIKNSVDIHLCIEAMKTLYNYPNITTYIFATGDRDFIPLVNSIRQHGKWVVVIGVGEAASHHLAQSADEFVLYRQLIDKEESVEEPPKDPYQALVEAVHLARERGNVCTLASLKLLMMEIMGGFDEKGYKDPQGRPFAKFKDFVKEAERRGLVQIFTSGTVNEVFLPGEDPYELSHFASKPPSEEEKEEGAAMGIGPGEWRAFRDVMRQFDDPVLFVQIYNSLRGLRNQEVIDLSNAQIKEMIKTAIKNDLLIRSSRGAHRYYTLNPEQPLPK
jgi:uncharacterized protein (TIGR00288 family)